MQPVASSELQPGQTRAIELTGLRFRIDQPLRFNTDAFAGVCMANGCDYATAFRIARELADKGERLATVRAGNGLPFQYEATYRACRMLGVFCEIIPPKR